MKASELIIELNNLIDEHGDLEVVADCDHEIIDSVFFEKESWINNGKPAFEIGY